MSFRDVVLAVIVQVIWGCGLTLMKPTMAAFPPILFIALVYAIIAVVLTPVAPRARTPFLWMLLIAALGGSVQSCLLAVGVKLLPASTANLLLQSTVPFAVLMSWTARIDKPSLRNGLGCLIALAGVATVIGAPGNEISWTGIAAVTGCSLSWAAAQVLIRLHCKDSGMVFYTAMARHAAPQALLASLLFEQDQIGWLTRASLGDWAGLVAIAMIGFAAGYMLWYRLLVRSRIDQLLPFTLLMPAMGVATGVIVLGEGLPPSLLAGGAVILLGLAVIVWPSRRSRAGQRPA
ncbi:MAG TPA: DMT family transporter [Alphaproteobacteria bacterium]|nr:DMT family transporter [Alphaproteobacteria bacterium]